MSEHDTRPLETEPDARADDRAYDEQPEQPARPSGRHPLSVGYLVMGVAFCGLVAIWSLVVADVVSGDDVSWLLPAPWILAGVAGLLGTVLRQRRTT